MNKSRMMKKAHKLFKEKMNVELLVKYYKTKEEMWRRTLADCYREELKLSKAEYFAKKYEEAQEKRRKNRVTFEPSGCGITDYYRKSISGVTYFGD